MSISVGALEIVSPKLAFATLVAYGLCNTDSVDRDTLAPGTRKSKTELASQANPHTDNNRPL